MSRKDEDQKALMLLISTFLIIVIFKAFSSLLKLLFDPLAHDGKTNEWMNKWKEAMN